ncbi:MAG TPA: hypothetical protein VHT27_03055 [Solirubrobacteraceae bacterium]|nr:hypothetical protein [Solirubrobacteraceae bacterium]
MPTNAMGTVPASAVPGGTESEERSGGVGLVLARNFDIVALLVGVGLALALGGPVFGLLAGAGGWLLQRTIAVVDRALIDRRVKPGSRLGADFIDAFARIWLLAGAIILAGAAGHRSDGLAAALVIGISYSLAFAVRIARGRPLSGAGR